MEACFCLHNPTLRPRNSEHEPSLERQGPEVDMNYAGMTFARLCAVALVNAPYVDRDNLSKGYYGEFTLPTVSVVSQSVALTEGVAIASQFFPWLEGDAALALQGLNSTLNPITTNTIDGWAHAHCNDGHHSCQRRAAARRKDVDDGKALEDLRRKWEAEYRPPKTSSSPPSSRGSSVSQVSYLVNGPQRNREGLRHMRAQRASASKTPEQGAAGPGPRLTRSKRNRVTFADSDIEDGEPEKDVSGSGGRSARRKRKRTTVDASGSDVGEESLAAPPQKRQRQNDGKQIASSAAIATTNEAAAAAAAPTTKPAPENKVKGGKLAKVTRRQGAIPRETFYGKTNGYGPRWRVTRPGDTPQAVNPAAGLGGVHPATRAQATPAARGEAIGLATALRAAKGMANLRAAGVNPIPQAAHPAAKRKAADAARTQAADSQAVGSTTRFQVVNIAASPQNPAPASSPAADLATRIRDANTAALSQAPHPATRAQATAAAQPQAATSATKAQAVPPTTRVRFATLDTEFKAANPAARVPAPKAAVTPAAELRPARPATRAQAAEPQAARPATRARAVISTASPEASPAASPQAVEPPAARPAPRTCASNSAARLEAGDPAASPTASPQARRRAAAAQVATASAVATPVASPVATPVAAPATPSATPSANTAPEQSEQSEQSEQPEQPQRPVRQAQAPRKPLKRTGWVTSSPPRSPSPVAHAPPEDENEDEEEDELEDFDPTPVKIKTEPAEQPLPPKKKAGRPPGRFFAKRSSGPPGVSRPGPPAHSTVMTRKAKLKRSNSSRQV